MTQVQERQGGGAPQSQFVEIQQQDQEEEFFDEQDDRGHEIEDTQVNRGRTQNYNNLGNQGQVTSEQKYQVNTQREYTQEQLAQDQIKLLS